MKVGAERWWSAAQRFGWRHKSKGGSRYQIHNKYGDISNTLFANKRILSFSIGGELGISTEHKCFTSLFCYMAASSGNPHIHADAISNSKATTSGSGYPAHHEWPFHSSNSSKFPLLPDQALVFQHEGRQGSSSRLLNLPERSRCSHKLKDRCCRELGPYRICERL